MRFYKIVFDSIPEFSFAHSYETSTYRIHFEPNPNKVEFSLIEMGDISIDYEDGTHQHFSAPCLHPMLFLQKRTYYSTAPLHRHFTFGIIGSFRHFEISETEVIQCWKSDFSEGVKHPAMAIFPDAVTDKKTLQKIEPLVRNIILKHSMHTNHQQLSCLSDLFLLLSILTDWCVRQATTSTKVAVTPSETVYCNRAADYIARHLEEKITVGEIADSLGISVGYLSHIFKSVTGSSVIEFINRKKIDIAKQLLRQQTPTRDIIESVGIADEKYFYRLFRQYTGMTAKEYRESMKEQYSYESEIASKLATSLLPSD